MRNRTVSLLLLVTLVGTAAFAVLPVASAQQQAQVTVSLNPPTEAVKPLQAPISFTGRVIFTGDYSGLTGLIGIPVQYTVTKQPAWATVLVSPATDVFPAPSAGAPSSGGYTVERPITITVTASDQAPAFTAEQIEVTATTTGSTGGNSATGKGNAPITAAYFSIIDVQLSNAIQVARPQVAVAFPVKISNFGNANTKVTFDITSAAEGFQTVIPNPITLQSKQAGGNQISADVPLTIQTPYKNGYLNEVGIVNYKLSSAYALDPKIKGDESSVSVLVTTRGFYVPGPSPILFVGLLGAIALALRRFR